MKEKCTPHMVAAAVLAVFIVLGLACASAPYELKDGKLVIDEGVTAIEDRQFYQRGLTSVTIPDSVTSISEYAFVKNQLTSVTIGNGVELGNDVFNGNGFRRYYNDHNRQAGTYTFSNGRWTEENLRIADEAKAEAKRAARAKFIIIPDNFDPESYTPGDLFRAAAASKNLHVVSSKEEALLGQLNSVWSFGLGGDYLANFVSDVTFIRQNGVDIEFASDDKAISQTMTIDQRSGLQAGQKVRVYYMITRSPLTTWDVRAIERR
jgi:hypothetical protein